MMRKENIIFDYNNDFFYGLGGLENRTFLKNIMKRKPDVIVN